MRYIIEIYKLFCSWELFIFLFLFLSFIYFSEHFPENFHKKQNDYEITSSFPEYSFTYLFFSKMFLRIILLSFSSFKRSSRRFVTHFFSFGHRLLAKLFFLFFIVLIGERSEPLGLIPLPLGC